MRLRFLATAAVVALGLSACVVATDTGTQISGVSQVDALSQALVGRQISRASEVHTLLPDGRVAGRFLTGPNESYAVSGSWSAIGGELCIGVETHPLCGQGVVNGNQLLHYVNGASGPDIWTIQ